MRDERGNDPRDELRVPSPDVCCICGSDRGVKFCSLCGHNFCSDHRNFWKFKGIWQRGVAAVSEWIHLNTGTPYCDGH